MLDEPLIQPDRRRESVLQQQLLAREYYDELTGLYNRRPFQEILTAALARAASGRGRAALVDLDIDDFRGINEAFGSAAADSVLREVASRLRSVLGGSAVMARWGSDEFAVLLADIVEPVDVETVGERVRDVFRRAFNLENGELRATASIGIAVYPDHGEDAWSLLRNAEAALNQAKAHGGRSVFCFDATMAADWRERLTIETALDAAIRAGDIQALYQPELCLADGRLAGAEVLARWVTREGAPIPPGRFIPIAEQTGLIGALGDLIFGEALQQAARWREAGLGPAKLALNLSTRQILDPGFERSFLALLAETGLPPPCLELEITETSLMADLERSRCFLGRMRDLGLGVALDDFGTGYSSLSLLQAMPLTTIKIDKDFIFGLPGDVRSRRIVQAIVGLAQGLDLTTVAEGVETEAQRDAVEELGCDLAQGYLFAPALSANDFTREWLAAAPPATRARAPCGPGRPEARRDPAARRVRGGSVLVGIGRS